MESVKKINLLTSEESDIISQRILFLEDKVKRLGPDIYNSTKDNSLTGRYYCFNFLNDEIIGSIMIPKLRNIFGSCVVQCWANTYRKGEGIGRHCHANKGEDTKSFFIVGNIFLRGDPNIGICVDNVKYINKIGEMILFSPKTFHCVDDNPTDRIRITMAIDVYIGGDEELMKRFHTEPDRYIYIK
jgi:hypothetical protein